MIAQHAGDPSSMQEPPPTDDMPIDLSIDDNPDLRSRMGRYLGGIRKQRNISQRAVAKHIGWSRPHLSNIEMGRSRAGWKGLREMAAYYGFGVQQLIDEVEREMPFVAPSITDRELAQYGASGATPWPTQNFDAMAARHGAASLSTYEEFILGQLRTLDRGDQKRVVQQIMQLVQQRADKLGDG